MKKTKSMAQSQETFAQRSTEKNTLQSWGLSNFSSGVYLFKLQSETSNETVKVVKK